MNIQNDKEITVYKNDYGKYSVIISKKNQDDTFESAYIPIQFNKDVELENKTRIKIINAWLSFYKYEKDEEKHTVFYIRCSDFEIVKEEKNPFEEFGEKIKTEFDVGQQIQITDDDLPF